MLRPICAGICALLIHPITDTHASTVFRCEDDRGHITYTLHGCPESSNQDLQDAYNPTPGKGKAVPLAKASKTKSSRGKKDTHQSLVVVGSKQDGCGNKLTSSEKRRAVIRQQVRGGMSQRDVESALGEPDRISSNDGMTRYHYADEKGNKRQVTFDEGGCVQEKKRH
ncbi:hypothetical protein [Pseudomonas sp. Gutcm_11s]|uniref:hypothetical protein n=1 Tax=Pseudomonas sp. Gutcm_11s TaxID=3026088 RepID=UPI00235EC36E|nr:hypothetical protein [Pseudomonas sp. Gutcm_11s]MDD0843204.1 hypothetical protein [Pseudomonas sp. Gutcm_11s]